MKRILRLLMLAATAGLIVTSVTAAPEASDLLRLHRESELRKLEVEVASSGERRAAKGHAEKRHDGAHGRDDVDFLARLPRDVVEKGRALAGDQAALREALARGPSLALLVAIVPHTDNDVRKSRMAWQATMRQYEQASFLDDLIARYRAFVRELDPAVGPGGHRESPAKVFYFPSATALRGELVRWAVERDRLLYEQARRHAISLIAHNYQAAWYAARSVGLLGKSRELFADMESLTLTQLQVGKVSQADSLKAQSALAVVDTRIVAMEQEGVAARAAINSWLGLPVDTPWGPIDEPTLDDRLEGFPALWARAQRRRQELERARVALETARTLLRFTETTVYPRASLSATVAPSRGAEAGPGRDDEVTFPSGPSPSESDAAFGSKAAWIDELRLRVKEAEAALDAEKAMTMRELRVTLSKVETTRVLRDTYRDKIVPKAALSFETLRSRYVGGQTPYIEFLDAGRSVLESSMEEVEAGREYWNNMVDLMEWTGGTLVEILATGREAAK